MRTPAPKLRWPATIAALVVAGSSAFAQGGAAAQGGLSPDTPVIAPAPGPGQSAGDGPKTPLPPRNTPRAPQPGQKAVVKDPDWPCVQVKVAKLSWGQMWSGPSLGDAFKSWRDDEDVAELVSELASRRTRIEDAKAKIEQFADAMGDRADARLTELFAGVFETLNDERSRIIAGIERYARKQRDLSERIKQESLKIADEQKDMAAQNSPEAVKAQQTLAWDTRIYDERQQSLAYVCESPVLLEQRAFDLGRKIQSRLKQSTP